MYKIENGVPVPIATVGRLGKYPFKAMNVGDSFSGAIDDATQVSNAANNWRRRHPGWRSTTRTNKQDGTFRIWRTA